MTTSETITAMRKALARCTFLPGSPHKRFARDLAAAIDPVLTEAQRRHLIRLCWRYRRQMPAHLVPSKDAVEALDAGWNREREEAARLAAEKRSALTADKKMARSGPCLPLLENDDAA